MIDKSVLEFGWAELVRLDGSMLVAIREALGLSPEEMAEKLQCHSSTLNRYENERIRIPVLIIQLVGKLLDEARAARGLPATLQAGVPPSPTSDAVVAPVPPDYSDWVEMVPARPLPFWMPPLFVRIPAKLPVPPGTEAGPAPVVFSNSAAPASPGSAPALVPPKALSRHQRVERWAMAACLTIVFNAPWGANSGQTREGVFNGQSPSIWSGVAGGAQPPVAVQEKALPPFKLQKQAPCAPEQGEYEADKRCWWILTSSRPCPSNGPVKYEGMCLVPIPEPTRKPVADNAHGEAGAAR